MDSLICTRRGFIASASAFASASAVAGGAFCAGRFAAADPRLTLVLAGLPCGGSALLARQVSAVLGMQRLPGRCIVVGGVNGADAALAPLAAAGIEVFAGPGAVSSPDCDFVLLGGDARLEVLRRGSRPVFACLGCAPEGALRDGLAGVPNLAGVLHCASHRWLAACETFGGRLLPSLALPSAGAWGDIGHVLLRTGPEGGVAELRQDGFVPLRAMRAEAGGADWRSTIAANRGESCRFRWLHA